MKWCDLPRLPDLVALALQMNRDDGATRRELRERDRALAVAHGLDEKAWLDSRRLLGWLRHVDEGAARSRAGTGWWVLTLAGWGLSVLVGVLAALALFAYDGTRPVNVLAVLGVFVAVPLVTAALSLIGMVGWLPGSGALRAVSPAGVLWSALGRLPGSVGETAEQLRGEVRRGGRLLGGAGKWAAWSFSQAMGLWFVLAGLGTFLFLLATTDLAFGWASTFELEASWLQRWLARLLWFRPGVVPDVAMIEQTMAERAASFAERYAQSPESFKAWWRPLMWLMGVYALLPRVVLALVAAGCSRRASAKAFAHYPGGDEVVRRLTLPVVRVRGGQHGEAGPGGAVSESDDEARVEEGALPGEGPVICWSRAPMPGVEATAAVVEQAGGECSLEQDKEAADRAAGVVGAAGAVRVFVKAWEPPLGDFVDFLEALRERVGDGRMVHVVAVTRGHHDEAAAAVWKRKLAAMGDPWLRVAAVARLAEPEEEADGGEA